MTPGATPSPDAITLATSPTYTTVVAAFGCANAGATPMMRFLRIWAENPRQIIRSIASTTMATMSRATADGLLGVSRLETSALGNRQICLLFGFGMHEQPLNDFLDGREG